MPDRLDRAAGVDVEFSVQRLVVGAAKFAAQPDGDFLGGLIIGGNAVGRPTIQEGQPTLARCHRHFHAADPFLVPRRTAKSQRKGVRSMFSDNTCRRLQRAKAKQWTRPRTLHFSCHGSTANFGLVVSHLPLVKSGHFTGALPAAIDCSERGKTTLITTES